jgi:hypothetical protein
MESFDIANVRVEWLDEEIILALRQLRTANPQGRTRQTQSTGSGHSDRPLKHEGSPNHHRGDGYNPCDADKDYFPLRVARVNQPGLAEETDPLIDQIRTISNRRFMGTQPLATLSMNHLKRVEEALKLLVDR